MTAVILDTDIGTDIDDTWALAMLLGCPELDLRLVVTATGDTTYRARLAAGILAAAGSDHVPIGIGVPTELPLMPGQVPLNRQLTYADEIDIDGYLGGVYADGVAALVDCVMSSQELTTIIAIGPLTNIACALAAEPAIATRARVVAMAGSVRNGGPGDPDAIAEYNVRCDVGAARSVFAAGWEVTITPLDTCAWIELDNERYAAIRDSKSRLLAEVMRNFCIWSEAMGHEGYERKSTTLFDTVAIYLGYAESLLAVERLPIVVLDDGTTTIATGAPELRVATSWRDADAFADHLVARLLAAGRRGTNNRDSTA